MATIFRKPFKPNFRTIVNKFQSASGPMNRDLGDCLQNTHDTLEAGAQLLDQITTAINNIETGGAAAATTITISHA